MAKKEKKKKRSLLSHLLRFFSFVSFAIIAVAIGFVMLIKAGYFGTLPSEASLRNIQNNVATEIYSSDNVLLGRYFVHERNPTSYENISRHVIDALVATEDARFYSHKGVDPRSLLRVLVKTVIMQDRSGGGGSTISQQLAKNLFPRTTTTIFDIATSKIKEALIAFQLESIYSKEKILELYLNTVPFGENIYGIELASQRFFSKEAAHLKIEEAAVLVGMLKANHTYNPRLFPERSKKRRNVVLNQMVKYGFLEKEAYDSLKDLEVKINYQRLSQNSGLATYFRSYIRPELEKWAENNNQTDGSPYNLYTDGLRIYTTIDSRIQKYAEASMQRNMAYLQKQFNLHWSTKKPWDASKSILDNSIKNSSAYKQLAKKGVSHEAILQKMKQKHQVDVFTHNGMEEKNISSIDSLSHYLMLLQSGLVALNPENGHIKAWIGGIDYNHFKYDHVATAKRQVGSTFKPFVYAAAIERGIDPCEHISGSRTAYTNLEGWTPDNASKDENVMKYSFKGALSKSVNTVTIKLLEKVGIEEVNTTAGIIGIDEKLPNVPSVGLGTASISLLEMTKAYCTFANEGESIKPIYLKEIRDLNGELLYRVDAPARQNALKKSTARLMNHMLREVVNNGTASSARWKYRLPNDIAGKTGTTQSNADGWFIGYNPKLVVGVWVGADDPRIRFRSTALGSGANMALPIFVGLFKDMNNDPSLNNITQSIFPGLSPEQRALIDCDDEMEDKNFVQKLFGIEKKDKAKKKEFGGEKKGLFQKLKDVFKKKEGS